MSAVRRIIVNTANAPSAIGPYNQVIIVHVKYANMWRIDGKDCA